ncbi:MAG TPA: hypothetical protein VF465_08590, partial [Flavobacterium sp.]|uniref:hypothetical protein n=1 Tax=Flavobacterium sp. TaxID=239 RepID=UPI002ED06F2C
LYTFIAIITKSYIFLFDKPMINAKGIGILLSFSLGIPILTYITKNNTDNIISRLKDNETPFEFDENYSQSDYSKIIVIIVSLLQVLFLWNGILNNIK